MHNVRTKWVRLTAPHLKNTRLTRRAQLHAKASASGFGGEPKVASRCSRKRSAARPHQKVRKRWLARPGGRSRNVVLHACHEAHHRGQVCPPSASLGFPLPSKVTSASGIGKSYGKTPARPRARLYANHIGVIYSIGHTPSPKYHSKPHATPNVAFPVHGVQIRTCGKEEAAPDAENSPEKRASQLFYIQRARCGAQVSHDSVPLALPLLPLAAGTSGRSRPCIANCAAAAPVSCLSWPHK